MADRKLKTIQIASLLVSTNRGTGFLIATGELALHQGLDSGLYAICNAVDLTVRSMVAPFLWADRQSVRN